MVTLLRAHPVAPVDVRDARVLCAAPVPCTNDVIFATDAPELLHPSSATRVTTPSFARGLASARYAAFDVRHALPEQRTVVLVLLDAHGLAIFTVPSLTPLRDDSVADNDVLAQQLRDLSRGAHIFSLDSLGSDVVTESFRVALADNDTVVLLDVNPPRGKVTVLGRHTVDERVVAVAFSEMTIVASTQRLHHMLRISRGGGIAVAATVPRSERPRRSAASAAVGESGAAVMSFFGGLFARRDLTQSVAPSLAFALPDNRWLLVVDDELITYSSFGARLEDMQHVFKSKVGMEANDVASSGGGGGGGDGGGGVGRARSRKSPTIAKSGSVSSLGSLATGMSHMTYIDQSKAVRAEKPPTATVFASPFVLSVTAKNELMAFAANGCLPGVIDTVSLDPEEDGKDDNGKVDSKSKGAPGSSARQAAGKIVAMREGRDVALVYWPDGRLVAIRLEDELNALREALETQNELRLALALVPAEQVDRMMALRRLLAKEARAADWHDAAIHHFEVVVNLSMRSEGVDEADLVAEGVELRGAVGTSWHDDVVTATLWADFLFRLRRRVMRASAADVDVLETLCRADESAARVKALLAVKHDIGLSKGEALITSAECMLREEERVDALVALYTSLGNHGKALLLLENTEVTNPFEGVVQYLTGSMRACDDVDVYFEHLTWVARRAGNDARLRTKVKELVWKVVVDAEDSEEIVGKLMEVLVDAMDDFAIQLIARVAPEERGDEEGGGENGIGHGAESKDRTVNTTVARATSSLVGGGDDGNGMRSEDENGENGCVITADVVAAAILAGMAKADALGKRGVFDELRSMFNARILHSMEACYHANKLLGALQAERYRGLGLHEELAFLLGRQGRHEAAADELAAESGLRPEEALARLRRMLPAGDKASVGDVLLAAYLRASVGVNRGYGGRMEDAAEIIRCSAGQVEMERALLDGRCENDAVTCGEIWPVLRQALISGEERVRFAACVRAMKVCEVRRLKEEVLQRRRRCIVVGHDRACTLCTRRLGDCVFAAYPDGSIAHLACHMSRKSA